MKNKVKKVCVTLDPEMDSFLVVQSMVQVLSKSVIMSNIILEIGANYSKGGWDITIPIILKNEKKKKARFIYHLSVESLIVVEAMQKHFGYSKSKVINQLIYVYFKKSN